MKKQTKTNYEVEGCWTGKNSNTRCRACGNKLKIVDREGHFNSKYWELERDDGLILVCCPNNCNVKEAEKCIRTFLEVRGYCVDDSKSWDYKLDYNKISNAWINRYGQVYPFGERYHIDFAFDRNTTEEQLEKTEWLKLSNKEFFWSKKLSKRQVNVIFDYISVKGNKNDMKRFSEYIEDDSGMLKTHNIGEK